MNTINSGNFTANTSQKSFLNVSGVKTIDAIYGPWESIDEFKSYFEEVFELEEGELSVVTIGIVEDDKVIEYWNPDGSANFVKKSQEIDLDVLDKRYVRAVESDEEGETVEIATKEYVDTKIADLINGAPESLDTLKEIGEALSNHANAADAILSSVASKANKEEVEIALANKADKSDLESLVSKEFVENAIASVDHSMYLTEHQDISNLATKEEVEELGESTNSALLEQMYGIINDCYSENIQFKLSSTEYPTIKLKHDIEIDSTLKVSNGAQKTLNLNGHSIKNGHIGEPNQWTSNCDAITVGANSTLKINGNGKVETLSRSGSPVYATGANSHIDIENGFYLSNGLNPSNGWSLIYADGGATISISGGYFAVVGTANESVYEYTLNCKDNSGSVITVTGGYFYESDLISHDHSDEISIPDGYIQLKLENFTYEGITGTWYWIVENVSVNTLESLNNALANKSYVTISEDFEINSTILVTSGEKILNLNGKHIANANTEILYTEEGKSLTSNVDAITVKTGAKLTIEGGSTSEDIGWVTTVSGGASPLYANGGTIIVNGGVYESLEGLDAGNGYSLVYADGEGKVEINDGYFIVNGNPDESKYQYILNCKDPHINAVITVKGGYFYNWSPANHDNNGHEEVVIPEGYEVEALAETTFFDHEGTWYHVVPVSEEENNE